VRQLRIAFILVTVALIFGQQTSAQSLSFSLFERYLESFREQAGIPAISAAIVQNGSVWSTGLGKADIAANIPARDDTPYQIAGLSQIFGSALLLRECVDHSYLSTSDRVVRWDPQYPDPTVTVGQLLTHRTPNGAYRFDLARYAGLTPALEQCAGGTYRRLLATDFFDRFGLGRTVPGATMASPTAVDRKLFEPSKLEMYASIVGQLATPYRVDRSGHATRSDGTVGAADMATGVISTVRDLATFDMTLSTPDLILSREALRASQNAVAGLPTGLGWFVQTYNGERVVWQFGLVKDAWSSLILKLPDRNLTLILLANSDGLSAPFALENGDVTTSLFARLFLKLATGQ
jgi:CubicO group peptidase (beta-lactamase class C family)